MRDYGLLASVVVAFAVPALLAGRWPLRSFDPPIGFVDAGIGPAVAGLAVGRLMTLVIDDRRALGRVADMLIIRSGVEFWPAVVAAVGVAALAARRARVPVIARLADLAPLAMVGYAIYEVACVLRDGCYGPASPIGLRPDGLSTRMLPVGIVMGVAIVAGAWVVRRANGRWSHVVDLLASIAIVATVRAVASFWLPHVGGGLTRPHRQSLVIAVVATMALAVMALRRHRASRPIPETAR